MGIETEQLVLDYLSRVGDLAHATSMTAAERARLVTGLRSTIDAERARTEGGASSPAAVRKILKGLGRPEEIVSAAARGGGSLVPGPRTRTGRDDSGSAEPADAGSFGTGSAAEPEGTPGRGLADAGTPPHLAGMDELSPAESDPTWWRSGPDPYAPASPGGDVGGFVGGIEIPEMLRPPPKPGEPSAPGLPGVPGQVGPPAEEAATETEPPAAKQGLLHRLRLRGGGLGGGGPRVGGVVELAAVLALVAGAVLGNVLVLGAGWLLAWWSPRLTRPEAKWAAAGLPGTVAFGAVIWLWGRMDGRWGEPVAEGAMQEALRETYPWVLRLAAAASAAFLLWRARRPRA
ncbi:hypothetical protein [Streptomyces alkaliterrae]|uniref:DUF2157 domain-containing protein n=1 Tax=Streptomyces alkaliterrae TaxID=2213162 RepID=A0A5P0YS06_9ACTN|nr:hypothetical protein [Streptomyces alkaliterrae]MBB1255081.1 hypothetical protein [Streptomyces alkaliterrae]MBB1261588.1 hypothetical protein [Streptomyces alkaliterrae]MQS03113.1 hypothetical protein [Streptomyces alkaliterrae]